MRVYPPGEETVFLSASKLQREKNKQQLFTVLPVFCRLIKSVSLLSTDSLLEKVGEISYS